MRSARRRASGPGAHSALDLDRLVMRERAGGAAQAQSAGAGVYHTRSLTARNMAHGAMRNPAVV